SALTARNSTPTGQQTMTTRAASAAEIGARARQYAEQRAAEGVKIGAAEAVAYVTKRDALTVAEPPAAPPEPAEARVNINVMRAALELADDARAYMQRQAAIGRTVSIAEAVTYV